MSTVRSHSLHSLRTTSATDAWLGALAVAALAAGARGQAEYLSFDGHTGSMLEHVNVIGDVDQDGVADFLLGAGGDSGYGFNAGYVWVKSGVTGFPIRFHHGVANSYFGHASANVGDLDGDLVPDYVIGGWGESSYAGSVTGFSGKDGSQLFKKFGNAGAQFGMSLAPAEDINGDFIPEILVGAPGEGKAYLIDRLGNIVLTMSSAQSNGRFGQAVANVGDIDGDGKTDLGVGAPDQDSITPPLTDCGYYAIWSGKTGFKLFERFGYVPNDRWGTAISSLADLNYDGKAEYLVGVGGHDSFGTDAGAVVCYQGGNHNVWFWVYGEDAGDQFGYSVTSLNGDMDGDGVTDFAVGAPGYDPDGDPGRVFTCSGATGSLFHVYSHSTDFTDRFFGVSIAGGDINGDGIADLLAAMSGCYYSSSLNGIAKVYVGAPASAKSYGSGFAGGSGVPDLHSLSEPVLGEDVTLWIGNSAGFNTLGLLFAGFGELDLPTSAGGRLLVRPALTMLVNLPLGYALLGGRLPDDPDLANLELDLQVLELDPAAAMGIAFTPGLELHLGYDHS